MLFAIYVYDMLCKLQRHGCKLVGLNFDALMYADDMVLLAPSRNELQEMNYLCIKELKFLDLKLNISKTRKCVKDVKSRFTYSN